MAAIKVIKSIRLDSKGVCVKDANGKVVPLHKRQGDMDGACAVYSLAMAMLCIGVVKKAELDMDKDIDFIGIGCYGSIDNKNGVMIYSSYFGFKNVRIADEMKKYIGGISYKTLSTTLKELEADQLIHREEYPQIPPKVEYSLTERGKSLIPILDGMCDWGDKNRTLE